MTRKSTSVAPRPICENHGFTMVKPMFSRFGPSEKRFFCTSKRALEKGGQKTCFLSAFALDFDHQNGSKSDGKAPPFFDAMQTAWKSSQTTGPNPFGTTYVAIHMIRSTICIYVYMYICIDLLLVALIIKVSPSTLSVSCTFIFKRESVCKAVAELLKIDPHWLQHQANLTSRDSKIKQNPPPGTPKMTKNASLKQRCFKGRLQSSIFGRIDDFLDLFFHQKVLKSQPKTMSKIEWFLDSLFH